MPFSITSPQRHVTAQCSKFWADKGCLSVRSSFEIDSAATGPPRHPPATGEGGGHIVASLYVWDDIVATRRYRETKLCIHLSEYLAEVVSKFGVDTI